MNGENYFNSLKVMLNNFEKIKNKLDRKSALLLLIFFLSIYESSAKQRLFVLLGQSNMAGRAPIEVADFAPLDRVFLLNSDCEMEPARNPLNLYSNIRKETYRQRLGPGYTFAKSVAKACPSDTILLVVNARGGTPIEAFMEGHSSGFYDSTLSRIKQSIRKYPSASLEAVIWHQGESNRETYKDYLGNLKTLIEDYRKDLNVPNMPFIVGQLGQWNDSYLSIRKEIAKIEETIPNAYLVSSDQLTNFDNHHFDNQSQKILGRRLARKYLEIKNATTKEILTATGVTSFESLKEMIDHPIDRYVLVAAHRGDWRNAPENSLLAIQSAIDMGVDIVEVDVAITADSVLVLMHDKTLDRTTTCTGDIQSKTYEELSVCFLKDGQSDKTPYHLTTLKEALQLVKNRVLINLDKAEDYIPLVYPLLKETHTVNQAIFSSYYSYEKLRSLSGAYLDSVIYMPKVKHDTEQPKQYLDLFHQHTTSKILQTRALTEDDSLLQIIPYAQKMTMLIWLNSLNDFHCAGHTDEKAVLDPNHWGWFLEQEANIIQTDRPKVLLEYLRGIGYHN